MAGIPAVTRAEYRGDFRVFLVFDDGLERTVDFSPWLVGPVFEPLKDEVFFKSFFIEGGTLTWPNGADIAPETLYARASTTEAA